MKKWIAFVLSIAMLCSLAAAEAPQAKEYAGLDFGGVFNAFFAENPDDQLLLDYICAPLLATTDEGEVVLDGVEGLTAQHGGEENTAFGAGSVEIAENADGSVDLSITLREDIFFSDGRAADIDDLIFTIYVLADPSYDGPNAFAAQPVLGMAEYSGTMAPLSELIIAAGRENADFDLWDEAVQAAFWADADAAGAALAQEIVDTILADYLSDESAAEIGATAAQVRADPQLQLQLGMTMWGYGHAYFPGATAADYWRAMVDEYGGDIILAAKTESAGGDLFDYIEGYPEKYGRVVHVGGEVSRISGLTRTGDYSLTLRLAEKSENLLYALADLPIMPLHYYGDEAAYDYNNGRFGFDKGDLSAIRAVSEPLGCGMYVLKDYAGGEALLEQNPLYFDRDAVEYPSIRMTES